jgi:hypothetical protein
MLRHEVWTRQSALLCELTHKISVASADIASEYRSPVGRKYHWLRRSTSTSSHCGLYC